MTNPPSTAAIRLARPSRPRYMLLGLVVSVVACATVLREEEMISEATSPGRRQLDFLDPDAASPIRYGRTEIDQNFQGLVRPSGIDSSLFRRASRGDKSLSDKGPSLGYTEEDACDSVFLFMPDSFAHAGHGSQLNNYMLAAMVATFTNRAMVILDPPPEVNSFKSNSQFGCPPEAWETKMVRTGGEPKRVGWAKNFPVGFQRLVKHPVWLSRKCPAPCQEEYGYEEWEELRLATNQTEFPAPRQVSCQSGERRSDVVVMGGQQIRDYFWRYYREQMFDRSEPPSLPAAEWALRLGAAPHEARVFSSLEDRHQIWDYVSALMARSGILRLQPWIARDVEAFIKDQVGLPLDKPYDGMHVRRGDKLESDARTSVRKYWDEMGLYNEETGSMPRNYIPFEHYLKQFDGLPCSRKPRLVYVATDDPVEVRSEIDSLPKDRRGNTLTNGRCHRFRFVFSDYDRDHKLGYHIDAAPSKGDCDDRYKRNIAAVADLMVLAKSDVFVGEFNSNWGRLVRTFRLAPNDSAKVMNGAKPVLQREMRVAWGHRHPGPPGW